MLLYAATNLTDAELEQFTVIAYIFDADGVLKTRQVAPGRRTLEKRETKFSTMVLDGRAITPTDRVVIGVNQAQRTDSEKWWSAELEAAAKEAVKKIVSGLPSAPAADCPPATEPPRRSSCPPPSARE